MRLVSVLVVLALSACASPCPPYSGFVEGRTWTFETEDTLEVRTVESFDDIVVTLRAVFEAPEFEATLTQTLECRDEGVFLLEDDLRQGARDVRTYVDPLLVLPPDPQVGDRFGGETYVVDSTQDGEVEETQLELLIQANDPIDTPVGELEVLAFLVVGPNGDPLPGAGVLRHEDFGLVDILGGGDLVSLEDN
jgi:hypothetical protein